MNRWRSSNCFVLSNCFQQKFDFVREFVVRFCKEFLRFFSDSRSSLLDFHRKLKKNSAVDFRWRNSRFDVVFQLLVTSMSFERPFVQLEENSQNSSRNSNLKFYLGATNSQNFCRKKPRREKNEDEEFCRMFSFLLCSVCWSFARWERWSDRFSANGLSPFETNDRRRKYFSRRNSNFLRCLSIDPERVHRFPRSSDRLMNSCGHRATENSDHNATDECKCTKWRAKCCNVDPADIE